MVRSKFSLFRVLMICKNRFLIIIQLFMLLINFHTVWKLSVWIFFKSLPCIYVFLIIKYLPFYRMRCATWSRERYSEDEVKWRKCIAEITQQFTKFAINLRFTNGFRQRHLHSFVIGTVPGRRNATFRYCGVIKEWLLSPLTATC